MKRSALVLPLVLALSSLATPALSPAQLPELCVEISLTATAGGRPGGTIVTPGERIDYTSVTHNCSEETLPFRGLRTTGHAPAPTLDDTTQAEACPNPDETCPTYQPFAGPGIYQMGLESPPQFENDRFGEFALGADWIVKRSVLVPDIDPLLLPAQMCSHFHSEAYLTELQLTLALLLPPNLASILVPPDASDDTLPDICFTVVSDASDLSIVKSDSADPVLNGQSFTYTLAAHNDGPDADTNVTITDTLPSSLAVGTIAASQGTCAFDTGTRLLTCNLGTMNAGADATVTIEVTPQQAGEVSNTASITGDNEDPVAANNMDTETTQVNPAADLSITKSASQGPLSDFGAPVTYTLVVHNAGPDTDPGVTVTDTLPTGVIFVSASSSQGSCSRSGSIVTCTIGAMAPGPASDVTVTIVVRAQIGTHTNTASVTGSLSDPDPADNTASTTTTVTAP